MEDEHVASGEHEPDRIDSGADSDSDSLTSTSTSGSGSHSDLQGSSRIGQLSEHCSDSSEVDMDEEDAYSVPDGPQSTSLTRSIQKKVRGSLLVTCCKLKTLHFKFKLTFRKLLYR